MPETNKTLNTETAPPQVAGALIRARQSLLCLYPAVPQDVADSVKTNVEAAFTALIVYGQREQGLLEAARMARSKQTEETEPPYRCTPWAEEFVKFAKELEDMAATLQRLNKGNQNNG